MKIEKIQQAYSPYWEDIKDLIDSEGWVYVKDLPYLMDVYFQEKTEKEIEYQKSFGLSGDNPHWLTRGARWRPKELSKK